MKDVEKHIGFYESELGRKVLQKEAERIREEFNGLESILDVGCGIGVFQRELSEMNITGLDYDKEMIEEARKRSGRIFILGEAENLGVLGEGLYDGVYSVATIEYIKNYQRAIGEIWKATKPAGKILAMIINPKSRYFQEQIQ